jgi:hypothetical membrane protein
MNRDVALRRGAGAAWLASALVYAVTELAAASRFRPTYSFSHNFISDLGVSDCGPGPHGWNACSPLYGLMNAGFIAEGLLFIVAVALMFRLLSGGSRYVFTVLGVTHGIGLALAGIFHGGGTAFANGLGVFHVIGACMAIFGGNLAILISPAPRALSAPRFIGLLSRVLPVVGLLAVIMLAVTISHHRIVLLDYGAWERLSVYTIMTWEAVMGGWLLVSRRR